MASRTISLEQSAYERLAAQKRPGESFSDVVNRLAATKEPSLMDLVGALSAGAADDLKETVLHHRKDQAKLEDERRKRLRQEN